MEQRISAIVPAYNEAPRIARVLEVLTAYRGFHEVIVVDDGSTDGTADIAARFGVRVIKSERNLGKGAALERGVRASRGDIFFFCDADIVGLSPAFIGAVVGPVARGERDMFIGVREKKIRRFAFGVTWTPLLDGQRALARSLWESVPQEYKKRFQIEPALNYFAAQSTRGLGYMASGEISQMRKEEKLGLIHGKLARFEMYRQLIVTHLRLWGSGVLRADANEEKMYA